MKKNARVSMGDPVLIRKMLRIMKLSVVLLLISLQISATNYAQDKLNLNARDVSILEVLKTIEKQSSYRFSYRNDLLPVEKLISVTVVNADIDQVMSKVFEGVPVEWKIVKRKNIIISPVAGVYPSLLQAAALPVKGTVTDKDGKPLSGVTVMEKGTNNGAVTGADGSFSLTVKDEQSVLEISSVGYQALQYPLAGKTIINITLIAADTHMDEVVVIGYGTQRRANLTGAVSTISTEELAGKPVVNVVEALQGTAPGLIIQQNSSQPGSRIGIRIRGERTLNDNNPLVIIDGIINADIQNVIPSDIENISILKDASSTAIYGSRASNGVILITTKKGSKGKASVNYDFMYGMQNPTALPRIVDSWVYAELRNEALYNSGRPIRFTPEEIKAFRTVGPNVNWMREIYKSTAPQQSHNLSISGGEGKTTYLASLGYLDQNSLLQGSGYGLKRYNARLNLETQVSERLKMSTFITYARNEIKDHAYWTEWIIEQATRMPPIYPTKDSLGKYTMPSGSNSNALARLEKGGYRQNKNDDLAATVNGEYKITTGLFLKGMIGARLTNNFMHEDRKAIAGTGDQEYRLTENFGRTQNTIGNLMLTYDKRINDHVFDALAGYSYEGETYKSFQTHRLDQKDYDIFVGEQSDKTANVGWANDWTLFSLFGRLNYNYKSRYMAEFNIRRDASSKFSKQNRAALFPSVAAAWTVSQEDFYAGIKNIIPLLKIRSSYGWVGNNRISDYLFLPSVTVTNGYNFGNNMVNVASYSVYNPDVKWETTRMFNVGLDMGLLNNRLNITADIFDDRTFDILVNLPLTGIYGFGNNYPVQNAAVVSNRGWELKATYNFATANVQHTISGNITDTRNKVIDMKGTERIDGYDVNTILKEGYPLYSYYAYRSDGFFENEAAVQRGPHLAGITPKPGDIRYLDKNGDGVIKENDDRFILGNRFPRYTYGANYGLNWKGLDFSMLWQGVGMRSVWLRGESVEAFHNNNEGPVFDFHINRWTPGKTDATYPRLTVGAESANNAAKSDFWIDNAAYLRLRNAQIGYTLSSSALHKLPFQSMRIYATVQNALTFTKMKGGWDPETADGSGRIYPVNRVFAFGLNVKF